MQIIEKVQQALRHVNGLFPEVTQVFFGADGRWFYCSEHFEAPDIFGKVDTGLLEDAAAAAGRLQGFPCAFRLLSLADFYAFWDELANVPTADGHFEYSDGAIEEQFLHFPPGTPREEIWHWFEAQHPDFVVGFVQQGIRYALWVVRLTLDTGVKFEWAGYAADRSYAQQRAIAAAIAKTGDQVFEVVDIELQ